MCIYTHAGGVQLSSALNSPSTAINSLPSLSLVTRPVQQLNGPPFLLFLHSFPCIFELSRPEEADMLGYEWANPAAAMLLPYDPSAEEPAQEQPHQPRHQMLPLYDRSCLDLAGTLFSSPPPPAVTMAAASGEADYSLHHYGAVSFLPAPAPAPAMRIGLNLGVRTYFSSSPDGELMRLGRNVYRRSGGDAGAGVHGPLGGGGGVGGACRARCQAEGCSADLTRAKHYHRRHKVCEYHSKAAAVVAHGLTQRFCQQCSRFHVLAEFDHGKRSCRKRLADHNRRRRKTQPLPAPLQPPSSQSGANAADAGNAAGLPKVADAKPSVEGAPPGTCKGAPAAAALAAPASPTWMALGRCLRPSEGIPGAISSSSSSSTSSCSSSTSSVLQHLADFHPYDRRLPMLAWDGSAQGDHGH